MIRGHQQGGGYVRHVLTSLRKSSFSTSTSRPSSVRPYRVLGIETTCDDTAIALLEGNRIVAEAAASQFDINASYGGVVPHLAARAHQHNFHHVLDKVLQDCRYNLPDIDAIAVATGPGLLPCLKVGTVEAKALSLAHGVPLISVNHLLAHSLVARMNRSDCAFPYLLLLVSGGHCNLTVARSVDDYTEMGATLDDSVGEAFDKVARELGLEQRAKGIHFGRALEALAAEGDARKVAPPLPVPLLQSMDCNFSFSGLKSAVARKVNDAEGRVLKQDLAAGFQTAAVKHIVQRTQRALVLLDCRLKPGVEQSQVFAIRDLLKLYQREVDRIVKHGIAIQGRYGDDVSAPKTLVVAGGVAANAYLREELDKLSEILDIEIVYPPARLCTDNGVMIAWAGVEILQHYGLESRRGRYFQVAKSVQEIEKVDIRANWPLTN